MRKGVEARRTRSVGRDAAAAGAARPAARSGARCSTRWHRGRGRRGQRPHRRRTRRRVDALRRPGRRRSLLGDRAARRQGRADRPQRRRQDDAAAAHPRRAAADRRHGAPRHAPDGGVLRPAARRARPRRDARRRDQPGQRVGRDRRAAPRDELPVGLPVSPARAKLPLRTSPAASATGCCWRGCSRCRPTLVLDEPTNDLDIDTPRSFEELLQNYTGTVFLVSHDRRFLDNVVTSTIAWEGEEHPGLWREYEGGYEDWKLQRERSLAARPLRGGGRQRRGAPRRRSHLSRSRRGRKLVQRSSASSTSCRRASMRFRGRAEGARRAACRQRDLPQQGAPRAAWPGRSPVTSRSRKNWRPRSERWEAGERRIGADRLTGPVGAGSGTLVDDPSLANQESPRPPGERLTINPARRYRAIDEPRCTVAVHARPAGDLALARGLAAQAHHAPARSGPSAGSSAGRIQRDARYTAAPVTRQQFSALAVLRQRPQQRRQRAVKPRRRSACRRDRLAAQTVGSTCGSSAARCRCSR